MKQNLRIYLATQIGCEACEITKDTLGIKNSLGNIEGIDIHEVDLSSSPERAASMGVTKTPTIFIVEAEDTDNDGIAEEIEETHLWHQSGAIIDSNNLSEIVIALKDGFAIKTPIK